MLGVFGKVAVSTLMGMMAKLATEEFLRWAFLEAASMLVKSTKTKEDDKWLEKVKEMTEK